MTRPLAIALCLAGLAGPARAGVAPEIVIEAGTTGLVSGARYDDGGVALGVTALWAVEDRMRFGLAGFGHDQGAAFADLRDANDGTPLGRVEAGHRDAYGAAWRLEADAWSSGEWDLTVDGSWGYFRVEDDVRGAVTRGLSSTGFALGAGLDRALGPAQALGLGIRYYRLFNDATGRYVTAVVHWRLRGAREGTR